MSRRDESLRDIQSQTWDLLIVGGGIVGAGVARDASMRGLKVALVERNDVASGTSSRSSRLLHGGLRYLAQGRIGLVREASCEKQIIHRIAPHISEPLPFLFPTYKSPPWGAWPLWKLKVGVKLYDLLCPGRNFEKSSWLGREQMRDKLPGVRSDDLTGGVRYFDGLTNDCRLVIDTLRSAANAGATIANYCQVGRAAREDEVWECGLTDRLAGGEFPVRARSVANCAGPWADKIGPSKVKLRLTKGVHLVVDRKRFPVPEAVVMAEGTRILFAIPWVDRVILGTTDTDYNGSLDDISADAQDIRYILGVVNGAFPEAQLETTDVISSWAGVRPLLASPGGGPSDISRSHSIRSPEPGWWDVAGGKLTTYRLMAEQTVDAVGRFLGAAMAPCQTAEKPLLPESETDEISQIAPCEPSQELIRHFCRNEWAEKLTDVMLRRGGWHYYRTDSPEIAHKVAGWMAEELGWDASRLASELEAYPKTISTGANA